MVIGLLIVRMIEGIVTSHKIGAIEGIVTGHRIGTSKHKRHRSCVCGHIAGGNIRRRLLSTVFVHARKPLAIVTTVLCYAVAVASPGPL